MAFDGPAGLPCDGAKPFHAKPFPFVEAVGGEHPPMGGEKLSARFQKSRQFVVCIEKSTACKSIADNDIILRSIVIRLCKALYECDRKDWRIAMEKPFADIVMR